MSELPFYLKRLGLSRLQERLDPLIQQASQDTWSYEMFLTNLLEEEVLVRDQRALERRIKVARFPHRNKTLENFDFKVQISVKKQQLLQLASLRFVQEHANLIFLGPPGTGKTHLSQALGLKAVHGGYQVLFTSAVEIVTQLLRAQEADTLSETLQTLSKPDLLIIDEVGYIPFAKAAANLFFQLINRRYETGSLILTSNRAFSAWGDIFGGDVIVAAAMIDRLVHHAEVISLKGNSYRLRGKEKLAGDVALGGL